MVKAISEIDLSKLAHDPDLAHGLSKVFNQFDTGNGVKNAPGAFNNSSGATHELMDIVAILKDPDKTLQGIQKPRYITNKAGDPLGRRIDDYVVDGVRVDKKAWTPNEIQSRIMGSAKPDVKLDGKGNVGPGQLFRDLVDLGVNPSAEPIRWVFDKRANVLGSAKIQQFIIDAAKQNKTKQKKELGFVGQSSDKQFNSFLIDLKTKFEIVIAP